MQHYLLTKENAEIILNKARRLRWDDANEIMAIMRDLKPVRITDGEEESQEESQEEKADFTNKFSGTGDRNESKEESEANDKSNPNVGGPVY